MGVKRDGHGPIGRRHRDLVGPEERFRHGLQGGWLIVPFGEIAHDGERILRRMGGGHAGRTMGGVQMGAGHDEHGRAVAPGVVEGHGGVLDAHRAMEQQAHGAIGHLGVAMGHGGGDFFMGRGEKLGLLVHRIIVD